MQAYQREEQRREDNRQQIAVAASNVLQEPEGQLGDLRLLVTLANDKDPQVWRHSDFSRLSSSNYHHYIIANQFGHASGCKSADRLSRYRSELVDVPRFSASCPNAKKMAPRGVRRRICDRIFFHDQDALVKSAQKNFLLLKRDISKRGPTHAFTIQAKAQAKKKPISLPLRAAEPGHIQKENVPLTG